MKCKKVLTLILAAAMMTSMAVPVFAADPVPDKPGETTVDGTTTVRNPIYVFETPANLDIAINAFQKADDSGSQIFSVDQQIINKSDVALQVSITPKLTLGSGVKIVKTAAAAAPADPTDTSKKLYMEMVAFAPTKVVTASDPATAIGTAATASAAAVEGKVALADVTWSSTDYDADTGAATDAGAKILLNTTPANMTFALKEATYVAGPEIGATALETFSGIAGQSGAAAADEASLLGATMFRFMGSVNASADWVAADVKVSAVLDVRGMSTAGYTAASTSEDMTTTNVAGANLWLKNDAIDNGPSLKVPGTVTLVKAPTGTAIELNMGTDDGLATGVSGVKIKGGNALAMTTEYTFAAGKLTLKTGTPAVMSKLGDQTIVVTFSSTKDKEYARELEIVLGAAVA